MDNGDGGEGKVESGPPKLSSDIFVPLTDPIVLHWPLQNCKYRGKSTKDLNTQEN